MNLKKLQSLLQGDRKLYRKARSLLNCTDTESDLKLVLSVS